MPPATVPKKHSEKPVAAKPAQMPADGKPELEKAAKALASQGKFGEALKAYLNADNFVAAARIAAVSGSPEATKLAAYGALGIALEPKTSQEQRLQMRVLVEKIAGRLYGLGYAAEAQKLRAELMKLPK